MGKKRNYAQHKFEPGERVRTIPEIVLIKCFLFSIYVVYCIVFFQQKMQIVE
jgi:hypothetical protein